MWYETKKNGKKCVWDGIIRNISVWDGIIRTIVKDAPVILISTSRSIKIEIGLFNR